MHWDDKVEEWKNLEVTKAFVDNLHEALGMLTTSMIFETDDSKLHIMQGLTRAYLDMINTIEQGEISDPLAEKESSNGRTDGLDNNSGNDIDGWR